MRRSKSTGAVLRAVVLPALGLTLATLAQACDRNGEHTVGTTTSNGSGVPRPVAGPAPDLTTAVPGMIAAPGIVVPVFEPDAGPREIMPPGVVPMPEPHVTADASAPRRVERVHFPGVRMIRPPGVRPFVDGPRPRPGPPPRNEVIEKTSADEAVAEVRTPRRGGGGSGRPVPGLAGTVGALA